MKTTPSNILSGFRPETEVHLTRNQLMERWHVSKETLRRRERSRQIPVLKIGGKALYRMSDVLRIEEQSLVAA